MDDNDRKEFYLADLVGILWRRKTFIIAGTLLITLIAAVVILLSPKSYYISGTMNTEAVSLDLNRLEYFIKGRFFYYNVIFSNKYFNKEDFDTFMSFPKDKKNLADFCQNNESFKDLDLNSFSFSYRPDSVIGTSEKTPASQLKVNGIEIIVSAKKHENLTKYYSLMDKFTEKQIYSNLENKVSLNFISSINGTILKNKALIAENKEELNKLNIKKIVVKKYKNYQYFNSQIQYSKELKDFLPAPLQLQSIEIKTNELTNNNQDLQNEIIDLNFLVKLFNKNKFSIIDLPKVKNKLRTVRFRNYIDRFDFLLKRLKQEIVFKKKAAFVQGFSRLYILIAFIVSMVIFIICAFFVEWLILNKEKILKK